MFECKRELEMDSGCNSAWNLLHLTPEITKSAGTKQKLIATWPAITKRFPPRILMLNTLQLLDCLGNLARLIQSELIRMWAELHLLKFYLTSLLSRTSWSHRVTKTDAWLDTACQVYANHRPFPGELEGWKRMREMGKDRWCTLEGQSDGMGAVK